MKLICEMTLPVMVMKQGSRLLQVQKKENIVGKSIDKLKETSTDVWQGTQLLAVDVAAALGLLRRILVGDELTEKEKKALQRTLTDLASVVPIGFLMLLPVTAIGHAAMLAAIQRYVPALVRISSEFSCLKFWIVPKCLSDVLFHLRTRKVRSRGSLKR
ncbi:uncharacterized protein LOC132293254 isoform X1 [Cornus florida]|uniref:uncharacterized protein LOC132293254 isoform X1 n=1 Tax=Cornus florida TaxID=4283 RepID=UPI0028A18D7A|nr:uncharacterized protein LOC132293254 isoform X1 [Cornus florida]XP_059646619.1 uncharacterized protein LOC132293254 isoform X1 [Cornus florida]XP_059646620.1 uncharacterized protein LOC132293254 isoform X1 [Cornus florida]XP_059646621.1 uncharacterized protein LOC132293254 isoform X1 [Cornus florida]